MKIKKIERRIFSVLLIAVLLLGAIPIGVSAEEDIITNDENGIPDSTLYNYILSVSDSNNDAIMQKSEVENLKYIWCAYVSDGGGEKIKTLKGLNNLNNLVVIDVTNNALTSLDGIEGLNLIDIRAKNNELVDISAVENMKESLNCLDVSYNKLSKLPDLTGFSKLERPVMYVGTDFMYNKLTYNELYYNLPPHLTEDIPWLEYQNLEQSPDPIPDPVNIEINENGVSVKGLIIPDATLQVNQVSVDIENALIAYDVNLIRDYEKIQPNGAITISIPAEYSDCDVFWIKDDGTKVNMNATYLDGKYIFTTDHLSVYALVRSKNTEPTEETKPTEQTKPTEEIKPTMSTEPSSTSVSTSNVAPTSSQNTTADVLNSATNDTATKGNVSNDNGTIKTGDVSIAVIVLLLISSLAAGAFAFYRRKIK